MVSCKNRAQLIADRFSGYDAPFPKEDKLHWLRLLRTENVGPINFYHLLNRFGSAQEVLKRLPGIAQRVGKKEPLYIPSLKEVAEELQAYQTKGIDLVALPEPDYPVFLSNIWDAPPLVALWGKKELLKKPCFSIVGARNASVASLKMTEKITEDMARVGFVIASGMARGVDACVHRTALDTGTIAVMAGGIDCVYPPENAEIYELVKCKGLLISEAPLGKSPQSALFPRRNRLISGLSWGTLIVEAARRSGSLITAESALEQGRDVFAIPGHPLDPRHAGSNDLLFDKKANFTRDSQDILEEYRRHSLMELQEDEVPCRSKIPVLDDQGIEAACDKLLGILSQVPVTITELARFSELNVIIVRSALVELDLAGYLQRHPADHVSLASTPPSEIGFKVHEISDC